ncbi:hypothetical protein [Bacillus halotolerans]|nr:hypothetical protein [Bacillus halotolerans]
MNMREEMLKSTSTLKRETRARTANAYVKRIFFSGKQKYPLN